MPWWNRTELHGVRVTASFSFPSAEAGAAGTVLFCEAQRVRDAGVVHAGAPRRLACAEDGSSLAAAAWDISSATPKRTQGVPDPGLKGQGSQLHAFLCPRL